MSDCLICKSNKVILLYKNNLTQSQIGEYLVASDLSGKSVDLWQCENCGHVFVIDESFIKEATQSYQDGPVDELYLREKMGRARAVKKYLKKLEKIRGEQGYLLDVGCYAGLFLAEAKRNGWRTEGVEYSLEAIKKARELFGIETIRQGKIEEVVNTIEQETFDVVTMFDVIEHLTQPDLVISGIYNKMKSGGLLLISTPDISSLAARFKRHNWYSIVPSHLHYFSQKSLAGLLNRNNFEIIDRSWQTRYFSLDYIFYRLGIENRLNFLSRIVLPFNLFDQQVVIARKLS